MKLPEVPTTTYPYLTRVHGRKQFEKLHTNLGAAKNAIVGSGGYGLLFKWVDGDWKLLYDERGLPCSWQLESLAKEQAKTMARIDKNRRDYLTNRVIPKAKSEVKEYPNIPDPESFIEGYTAALMKIWDAKSESSREWYHFR